MSDQQTTILGISPGTHSIGIAVLGNNRLQDRRVKDFTGAWSLKKFNAIQSVIERLIAKYEINVIALKIPHPSKTSDALNEIINSVVLLSKKNNVKVYFYSIEELERYFSRERKVNKSALIAGVLEEYPELIFEHKKEKQRRYPYYVKVFEAIAAATLCTHEMK